MKISVLKSMIVTATLLGFLSSEAYAYNICQCVTYIKNRVGDSSSAGDAKNMGAYLIKNGYSQVSLLPGMAPSNKDIMIIQDGYDQKYIKKGGAGHVGIVSSARVSGDNVIVDLVSANNYPGEKAPASNERSEYSCDNVLNTTYTLTPQKLANYVSFYRK